MPRLRLNQVIYQRDMVEPSGAIMSKLPPPGAITRACDVELPERARLAAWRRRNISMSFLP